MLNAGLVVRNDDYIPRWRSADYKGDAKVARSAIKPRPLTTSGLDMRVFQIADTTVKVILDASLSPNDTFILPDWVGSHVVVTVNTEHPFWQLRAVSNSDKTLMALVFAIDGYVSWRTARLHEPPDATEQIRMRDEALRFCTLQETEVL